MASPAAGAEWTAVLTLPKFTKNTRHDKKAQTARHGTERGCEVGLNASGEKYMDFMLSNIVHTFIFSAELRLLLRRHMELHECTAQEAGSVASPGLALDQFYPVYGTTPVSYGAAPARPQAFGFGSAGVGVLHQGRLV